MYNYQKKYIALNQSQRLSNMRCTSQYCHFIEFNVLSKRLCHTLTTMRTHKQSSTHYSRYFQYLALIVNDNIRRFTFLLSVETTTPKLCSCTTNSTHTYTIVTNDVQSCLLLNATHWSLLSYIQYKHQFIIHFTCHMYICVGRVRW